MQKIRPLPSIQNATTPAKELFTCRICSQTGEHNTYFVPEFHYGTKEIFKYFECSNCGCLQHAEIPPDLSRYYPNHYYSHQPVDENGLYGHFKSILERKRDQYALYGKGVIGLLYQAVLPGMALTYLRHLNINRDMRILDVGSGSGHQLYFLADEGFSHVTGMDPFIPKSIHYANGLNVLKRDIKEMEGEWDVIIFNHSFEHIPNNLETLQKACELLADGGWCIIEIPTVSSYAWRHYGIYWHQLDAPRHIFLHSLESFRILSQKAGFAIQETQFVSNASQFWGSENYRCGVKPKASRNALEYIANLVYRSTNCLPQYFRTRKMNRKGLGDQVVFYLQKK